MGDELEALGGRARALGLPVILKQSFELQIDLRVKTDVCPSFLSSSLPTLKGLLHLGPGGLLPRSQEESAAAGVGHREWLGMSPAGSCRMRQGVGGEGG